MRGGAGLVQFPVFVVFVLFLVLFFVDLPSGIFDGRRAGFKWP